MTIDGVNLGTAYGAIVIDQSGIQTGVQQAQRTFDNMLQSVGGGLQRFGDSVASMGGSLTLLTAPLLAFGVSGIKTAADFDSAMIEISARTGIVGEDLQQISDFALQMGADTAFSAQQAADAFLQLLTSGQTTEQAMSTLPLVLTAAAASGEDLGQTADTLTDIMAAFGLQIDRMPPRMRTLADELGVTNEMLDAFGRGGDPGDTIEGISEEIIALADALDMSLDDLYRFAQQTEDASTVVESLARASGASSAGMASLGQGFANVGPVARNFGMSVDLVAATLAVLAENGIKGSEAGTALKSMLLNMSDDTIPVRAAWNHLGLSMYDAEGNMRDMQTVIWELDRALDALPVEEQNLLMRDLAGSYGITALSALRGELSIQDMRNAMDAQASAADVAAKMMEAFNIRVDTLKGSIEALQTETLTPFMNDVLGPFIERVTGVVNSLTEWAKANPELTSQIVKVAAVISGLGPTLLAVGKVIAAVGAIISNALFLPMVAITGVILAWQTNFLGLRDTLEPIFTSIGQFVSQFVSDIRNGINVFDALFRSTLSGFGLDAANGVAAALDPLRNAVESIFGPIIGAVQLFFSHLERGQTIANALFSTIASVFGVDAATTFLVFQAAVENAINAALNVVRGFMNFLGGVWAIIGPALENVARWFIGDALPAIVGFISREVIPRITDLFNFIGGVWAAVSPALLALLEWFVTTGFPAIIRYIETDVAPSIGRFFESIQNVWNAVRPGLEDLYEWFVTTGLPAIRDFIVDKVLPRVNEFITTLQNIWTSVSTGVTRFKNELERIFNWIKDNVIEPVADAIDDIKRAFDDLGRLLSGGLPTPQAAFSAPVPSSAGVPVTLRPPEERDSGGSGYANMPYLIRPKAGPELFYPTTDGQFIPNFDQVMQQLLGGGGGGGDTYNIMMPAEALNSPALAEQRGRDFGAAFAEEIRSRG